MSDREMQRGGGFGLGPHALAYARSERSVLRVLTDRVAATPDRAWLVFDGTKTLTYRDADEQATRTAAALTARGCAEGDRVAILMENRPEFIVALLGILRAGCIAVPLHARSRGSLLQAIIDDADPVVIFAGGDQVQALGDIAEGTLKATIVTPDPIAAESAAGMPIRSLDDWLNVDAGDTEQVFPELNSARPAVIQYTSGTTGRPKGAVCSHHFFWMYSALSADALGHRSADVLMTPLPLYHAAALHHVAFGALHCGAIGHIRSKFSATRFWAQARDCGANFVVLMGPMAVMLAARATPTHSHSVHRVFCTPPPPDVDAFEEMFGTRVLWQTYGMTEIYPIPMNGRSSADDRRTAVGRPSRWVDFGVVNEDGDLLGAGEVGEMVFRPRLTKMMAEEYFRRPEETAEAFRGLMFHTGDMGYYDDDGMVYFVGRVADRIRRLGENIPAADIERVALTFPKVLRAAAFGIPSELGEDDVKLDVVGDVDVRELHDFLTVQLPAFMVPRYYERRDSFPMTPSERVRKNELRDLGVDAREVFDAVAPVPPTDEPLGRNEPPSRGVGG